MLAHRNLKPDTKRKHSQRGKKRRKPHGPDTHKGFRPNAMKEVITTLKQSFAIRAS